MALFVGGEGIHYAVNRLAGPVGMQRPEYQDTHFGGSHGRGDGFKIA